MNESFQSVAIISDDFDSMDPTTLEGYSIRFNKEIRVIFNNEEITVRFRIFERGDNESLEEVRIEMLIDSNVGLFLVSTVTAKDFDKIKAENRLRVDFFDFTKSVIDLLERSVKHRDETFIHFEQNEDFSGDLTFSQKLKLRKVKVFGLHFEMESEDFMRKQIQFRYNRIKHEMKLKDEEINKTFHRLKEKNPKSIILTIGDGANDVDMIRCADVGVGLEGREGSSAVLSSDVSIPTFCKLSRLLIVHGRFNCNRTSLLVLVTFYKNLLLGLPQLFYGFSNGFTATSIFDSGFFAMYNAVLTVPQHFIACALEEDLSPSLCLKFPEVYKDYQNNGGFTLLRLFWFYLIAFIHSALIYFIPVYSLESSLLNEKGTPLDHSLLTQIVGWSLMCVFTYEMFHIFHCITILHILLNIFCFFSNFIIQFLYAKVDDEYHEILNRCSDVYLMWITIPLIVGACVILDMCKELIKSFYAQNKSDKLRLLGMNKMKK